MVANTVPAPPKPKRYYHAYGDEGWIVMDRWPGKKSRLFYSPSLHSTHNTREEAEAVALALNELTG